MTNSQIFKAAWNLAKKGQSYFGGNLKQYFSEALMIVHELVATAKDYEGMGASKRQSMLIGKGTVVSRAIRQSSKQKSWSAGMNMTGGVATSYGYELSQAAIWNIRQMNTTGFAAKVATQCIAKGFATEKQIDVICGLNF